MANSDDKKSIILWRLSRWTYDVAEARVCHVKYHSEGHPRFLLSIALQPEGHVLLLVQYCFCIFNVKFDLKPDCWRQTGISNERLRRRFDYWREINSFISRQILVRRFWESAWLHTELVALLVVAMEVDSASLKHPFGYYALGEIWKFQAEASYTFSNVPLVNTFTVL